MKEPDPPDSDDDGWGDAENAASPPASEAAVDNEWDDPADLEKRVAALREQREAEVATSTDAASTVIVEEPVSAQGSLEPAETWPGPPPDPVSDGENPVSDDENAVSEDATPEGSSEGPELPETTALPDAAADLQIAAGLSEQNRSAQSSDDAKRKASKTKSKKPRAPGDSLTTRQQKFIIGGSAALLAAAVLAILGWFNSQNYYLTCGTETISAEQGRFWPWGASALPGPEFRPIRVPSDVLCSGQEFDSKILLEEAFLEALLKQSTALLTSGDPDQVGTAEAQLEQALLLTRSPERATQRTLAQRLQGDVSYWRGAAHAQAAAELLHKSAEHFKEAAARRPRHTSDADSWAEHARFMKLELDKGPRSLRADEAPKDQPQFLGLSPQEPTEAKDKATPSVEGAQDAGVIAVPPDEAPPDAGLPPADAALPKGGVLL